jgi:hypothetical protein
MCQTALYTFAVESEDLYEGIPVIDLPVMEVDVPDPVHLRRSLRYQGEIDLEPAAAVEAALDLHGLIARDPQSRTGEAVRVVGFSPTAGRLLVVVLLPHDHPPTGLWHVVTAWPAGRGLQAAYAAADEEEMGE